MDKVDIDIVYKRTLKEIKSKDKQHPILQLEPKEQIEFMELLLKGQGYFIREGIKNGTQEMALPGFGTFLYNPLRKIVNLVKNKFKDTLLPFEINQLIKENLMSYYKEKGDPFKTKRATIVRFNYDELKNKNND